MIGTLIGTYLLKSFANDILLRLLGFVIILFLSIYYENKIKTNMSFLHLSEF
jgi:hypothetical protein